MKNSKKDYIWRTYGIQNEDEWDHFLGGFLGIGQTKDERATSKATTNRAKHEETAAKARVQQEAHLTNMAAAKAKEAMAKAQKAMNEAKASAVQVKTAQAQNGLSILGIVLGIGALAALGIFGYQMIKSGKRKALIQALREKAKAAQAIKTT